MINRNYAWNLYLIKKKTNRIAFNRCDLTSSYKELLDRADIQALVNEAGKGRIQNYDQAIQLDQIFEWRINT